MLNNLFKPSVSRSEHERILKTFRDELDATSEQRDDAYDERDVAIDQYAKAVDRELTATALLQRACILLKEVDPSRTGGKQLRDAREKLFADAMLAGLWGESKE